VTARPSIIADTCSRIFNQSAAGDTSSRSAMRASTRSGEGIAPHRSGVDTRRRWRRCEWHRGELYPCVGFIVTNMTTPAERVLAFYNQRGTAGH